nr:hypothetical protein [Tanacetum cinerariifolium]
RVSKDEAAETAPRARDGVIHKGGPSGRGVSFRRRSHGWLTCANTCQSLEVSLARKLHTLAVLTAAEPE